MYGVSAMTCRPWNLMDVEQFSPFGSNNKPLYRSHQAWDGLVRNAEGEIFAKCNPKTDKLIVLVRNYRECMLRHFNYCKTLLMSNLHNKTKRNLHYFQILNVYDQWDDERRLLVHYEDLMQNPKSEFKKVADFLNVPPKKYKAFISNIAAHAQRGYIIKKRQGNRAYSRNKGLDYHTKKVNHSEFFQNLDHEIKMHYPDLWAKYLMRYEYQLSPEFNAAICKKSE